MATNNPKDKHFENKKLSQRRDSAGRRSLRCLGPFKMTDFDTNRKPVCDFLLLNDANILYASHLSPFARYRAVLIKLWLLTSGASFKRIRSQKPLRMSPQVIHC